MSALTESGLDPANAIYDFTLPAGEGWSREVLRGQTFRIVDLEGNQAADTLFYDLHEPANRYSAWPRPSPRSMRSRARLRLRSWRTPRRIRLPTR